ncbi:putative iron-regulated membrane protein [Hephaestia caeni]|uniref:Putative iron-regulated membrane protein n=1 Tax=Hephaestia caeni TaxID=645617 RepID=A0A397NLZ1_9SPHN|nr:PepSY-associated TM helix domain-containing protein [Hephaestia caeni]RIA36609.1 putative iron-regulated membrane protein [Hephaestia caeni]
MKESLRQSMAWLHTWVGLLFGWLLFAMFATGTAAYFQEEITRWMQPEVSGTADPVVATEGAVRYLASIAPDAKTWFITPPNSRSATTQVFWQPAEGRGGRGETSAVLDGSGHKVEARQTRGGFFLYRFHFDLHYMPVIWARYLVGIAAMFMLVAILSGIVTHKKIFVDFFMLRFGKGQRSWLDAHNVTAVLALPFHLMITFTGLVTLATLYMPWGIAANYADPGTFFNAVFAQPAQVERSGRSEPLAPIGTMMRTASAEWGGADVGYLNVINPGDATATVTLTRAPEDAIGSRGETLTLNGVTGRPLEAGLTKGPALETESVMIGLHAGRFAQWGLRWLYFLSGVAGTIMVGSGLVLWTVKRRAKLPNPDRPHFGFRLVERLNVAAIAGLGAGLAVYFLANRLLPSGMENRADWEIHALFIAWGAVLAWAIVRPTRRAWVEGLAAAALLYTAVPVVNALTTPRNLFASLAAGDWLFVGFDCAMLMLAAGFGWAARKAARVRAAPAPRRRTADNADVMAAA